MDRLKQTLAYVLYYTGHWISSPMARYDLGWLYPLYNWCMIKSADFDLNERLWRKPQCQHEYDHNGECLKCDESILDDKDV